MNGNKSRLIRKGAKILHFNYNLLKKGYKNLGYVEKLKFLKEVRVVL